MARRLSVRDLDLKGKRVLIRVDFNVPLNKDGTIADDMRIVSALPTIQYVIQQGGKAIVMSHLGRPKNGKSPALSLAPCALRLSELLKKPVVMAPDCIGEAVTKIVSEMKDGDVVLLENLRFYPAEEKPELDPSFAQQLAALGDCYINDAFGAAHRAHSSTVEIAKYFPTCSAAGLLMEKEIAFLDKALKQPEQPFYAIIGGAKVSTKIQVLHSLLEKVEALFIGGAMAYTFFAAQGKAIGDSLFEKEMIAEAEKIMRLCTEKKVALYLPVDTVAATHFDNTAPFQTFENGIPDGYQGMDIGKKTVAVWSQELKKAKTVFWNGPVGVFEFENFAKGTFAVAHVLASMQEAITIAGGGETVAAINEADLTASFTHISTGGGATLEYIEQGTLPGIEGLCNNKLNDWAVRKPRD